MSQQGTTQQENLRSAVLPTHPLSFPCGCIWAADSPPVTFWTEQGGWRGGAGESCSDSWATPAGAMMNQSCRCHAQYTRFPEPRPGIQDALTKPCCVMAVDGHPLCLLPCNFTGFSQPPSRNTFLPALPGSS